MKTKHRSLTFLAGSLLAFLSFTSLSAAELSDGDKKFLAQYEQVRAALAGDNLDNARKAAADLGEEGAAIASSDKIETARSEFVKLSEHAIKLAEGKSGYYVVNCPMLKKDWVQPAGAISNPYAGGSMLTCGAIKKQTAPR